MLLFRAAYNPNKRQPINLQLRRSSGFPNLVFLSQKPYMPNVPDISLTSPFNFEAHTTHLIAKREDNFASAKTTYQLN